jgi:hypothetical protein
LLTKSFDDLPNAFSPSVFADTLGIARSTGYRIAREAGLIFQFGGRQVIFKTEFLAWIVDKRVKPLAQKPVTARPSKNTDLIARRLK